MFDLFRSRDKAVRYLLGGVLGIVALSMVVTLIPGYGTPNTASEQVVAEVGREQITLRQVQSTVQNLMRNRQVTSEMIQLYVPQIVDQMISDRAIAYQAERMGFKVSDEDLARAIRSVLPQGVLSADGTVNRETYTRFLGQQGLTIEEFEKNIRQNLLLLRLQNIALEGAIVTPDEVAKEYHRRSDKVKVDYVVFTTGDLRSQVTVTPAEVQDYFNKNRAQYTTPEKRSFNLLVADETKLGATVEMSDQQLQALYKTNMDRYRTPERVRVRHILVKTTEKPKEEIPKLEAKANDLLKQIRGGGDFAELAKKNSDDPGSAVKGGDLDWVTRGQTVPNFENTAFSLKPNEVSNVIKTEYGFHILQVLEKEAARVKPFEEVKDTLASEGKREAVYQRMQNSVEQARAELGRSPQQVEAIAAKYNLTFAKAENIGRGESVPEVGTNPELDATVAGLRKGDVSSVIQVGPTKLAVVQLLSITPVRPAEFAEVEGKVRETLTNNKVQQLTEQRVKDATNKLRAANGDLPAAAKAVGGEQKTTQFFNQDGAADGIGPASYLLDAFAKPVGSTVGPFAIGDKVFLAKVAEKQVADASQLASQRDELVLALKRKKAGERKDLFEDGLLARLIKEGKVKKNNDTIQRLINGYRG